MIEPNIGCGGLSKVSGLCEIVPCQVRGGGITKADKIPAQLDAFLCLLRLYCIAPINYFIFHTHLINKKRRNHESLTHNRAVRPLRFIPLPVRVFCGVFD